MKSSSKPPRNWVDDLKPLYDDAGPESEMDTTMTSRFPTPAPPPQDNSLARLVVLAGQQVGRAYVVGYDATIGRVPEMTIQLVDARVSRRHALLRPLPDGGFEIEDLGSRNGTSVNGVPVTRQTLKYGDRIQIGTHVLLFAYHDPVQEQVLQRQKLEAVGQLAGGVAHDFNNLLSAGIATLQYVNALAKDRTIGDPEVAECLTDLWSALKRGEELTGRLLGFQRRGRAEHVTIDISSLCEEVVSLARRAMSRSIELHHEIQQGLIVRGHQGELHQVLMNLLINARDAMPEGGVITLSAELSTNEREDDDGPGPSGSNVVITVSDHGRGIEPDVLPHVFEPFFSTKKGSSGTGLGLATVRDLVTAHGGVVTVESEVGEGTRFTAFLPALAISSSGAGKRRQRQLTMTDGEMWVGRILVVDDEELVRRSLGRLLRQFGHTVEEARDGEEAIHVLEDAADPPNVVVLDVEMPGLDGVATLERLRALEPKLAVVCVTGRKDPRKLNELRRLGVTDVLEKPFDASEFLTAVASAFVKRKAGAIR